MSDEIELEEPATFLRTALRVQAERAKRYFDEAEAIDEVTELTDVLVGIIEDVACYGGQPYVRDRIYNRIGAMYSCDLTTPHTHVDGLPGGGPYREQCTAR